MTKYLSDEFRSPIFTCKQGTNADLFPDILELYARAGASIVDLTYGEGVFWKKVDKSLYSVLTNDINPNKGKNSYDFQRLPYIDDSFDCVIFDPPYIPNHKTDSVIKDSLSDRYGLDAIPRMRNVEEVYEVYQRGMAEAQRILKPEGIMIVKCMDQVDGGKNKFLHCWIHDHAQWIGLIAEDLFIMARKASPMRHTHQIHARKNHSYFWVFRKMK